MPFCGPTSGDNFYPMKPRIYLLASILVYIISLLHTNQPSCRQETQDRAVLVVRGGLELAKSVELENGTVRESWIPAVFPLTNKYTVCGS